MRRSCWRRHARAADRGPSLTPPLPEPGTARPRRSSAPGPHPGSFAGPRLGSAPGPRLGSAPKACPRAHPGSAPGACSRLTCGSAPGPWPRPPRCGHAPGPARGPRPGLALVRRGLAPALCRFRRGFASGRCARPDLGLRPGPPRALPWLCPGPDGLPGLGPGPCPWPDPGLGPGACPGLPGSGPSPAPVPAGAAQSRRGRPWCQGVPPRGSWVPGVVGSAGVRPQGPGRGRLLSGAGVD